MNNIRKKLSKLFEKISVGNILLKSIVFALSVSLIFQFAILLQRCENVRENVFRLHVVANSDSNADQSLKLMVRDRIISESAHLFKGISTEEEAVKISAENIDFFTSVAREEIVARGYDYPVKISVGEADFNTRQYEDYTLPAGRYTALKIVIGEGKGKNWWCVMFPPMCLPAAQKTADEPEISDLIDKDGLELVCNGEKYRVKFKAVEIYEGIKARFF